MNYSAQLLTAICITSFMSPFMGASLNIAVPYISEEYGVAPQIVPYLISAFMICSTSFLLPCSAIANRFGYHRVYSIGSLLAAIFTVCVTLGPTFESMIAARGLQGMAFALVFCTSMALLFDNIPKEKRGMAVALSVASVYSGLSLAPFISGIITQYLNWRVMFYFSAASQVLSYILIQRVPKDQANATFLPYAKMLMSFAAIFMILLSLSYFRQSDIFRYILAAGVLLLVLFLVYESRTEHNIFPVKIILANRVFNFALGASTFNYMATFSIALLLSLHLQLVVSKSASFTGVFLVIQPVFMTIFTLIAGKIMGRISSHFITAIGMLLTTGALFLMSTIEAHTTLWHITLMQILAGIGFGLFSATNTSIVMESVERTLYALASGMQSLARNLGMALGIAIMTTILNHYIESPAGTTLYLYELSWTISLAFTLSGAVCVLGIICCVAGYKFKS